MAAAHVIVAGRPDPAKGLERTSGLALSLLKEAEDETDTTQTAIDLFAQEALSWLLKAVDSGRGDLNDLKKSLAEKVAGKSAERAVNDLKTLVGESDAAQLAGFGAGACGSAAAADPEAAAAFDSTMNELMATHATALTEVTDKLVNSNEFAFDLMRFGFAIAVPDEIAKNIATAPPT